MSSDASPTARALLALELLQDSPGITAERLAAGLRVSERAARRYVGILREAGIPVESERGPYGGYRLGRGVRLPPLVFSPDEALALVMAVLDGHHDASDPARPVGAALGKLLRALPGQVAAQAQAVRTTTAPAPDRGAARPDPATTTALVDACGQRRQVRLAYRSESGSQWSAEVDPWAVVVRHGRWYLLCRTHREARPGTDAGTDAIRAYRIDRVRSVEILRAPAQVPDDLDPVAVLEEHLAVGWEYAVDVVVEAPLDEVAARMPRTLGRLEPVEAGGTRLVASTSNPLWYAQQLAAVPVPMRVVGGPELRAAVTEVGRRLLAAGDASCVPLS
jgi:predicted DNA-binding transcriptional regulator YafY